MCVPGEMRAMIVSSSEKGAEAIGRLLSGHPCESIMVVRQGRDVRSQMETLRQNLIIINTPLSDEYGHELAIDLVKKASAQVLLLVRKDEFEWVTEKIGTMGVMVITKPVNPQLFGQAMGIALAMQGRLTQLDKENEQLKRKLEELRIVDRAKCLLIQHQQMSEAQAHRYIEKQAMNHRATRKTIAQNILRAYEV